MARIEALADRPCIAALAKAVAGNFGGKVGVAPGIFLKKLVGEVLDRVDQFPEFNPRRDDRLTVDANELTATERNLTAAANVDDVELEL